MELNYVNFSRSEAALILTAQTNLLSEIKDEINPGKAGEKEIFARGSHKAQINTDIFAKESKTIGNQRIIYTGHHPIFSHERYSARNAFLSPDHYQRLGGHMMTGETIP